MMRLQDMLDNIKKIISIVLAISLLWQDIGRAVPRVQPFANSPQPLSIFIPEQYGSIEKTNRQTGEQANRQTVVLIRDAHCNYEAQTNIARILEILIRDYKIDLVCVEGASGEVDTTIFASYPDKKVREKIADKYVKKGYLSACEALSIARSKTLPFSIYGIEDTGLYLENLKGFRNTIGNGKETARYIERLKNIINNLKPRIYNKRLMEFDKKQVEYEENKFSLTEWIRYINTWLAISKNQKNLHLSFRAIQLEEDIDFSVVERERELLIRELEKSTTKEELKELVEKSLLFRLGRLSSFDYYTYLEKIGRPLSFKKNLMRYIHLVKLQSRMESDGLFREIEEIEDRIRETLFNNEIERQLNRIARNARILNKLYSLTLTSDELAYYKDNKPEFSPQKVLPFITVQARINNITIPPELNDVDFLDKVEEFIQPAEYFYKKAIERDTAMVNNLLEKMEMDKKDKAVIVVGGFHSEGIIKKLEENSISYTVITPKITKAQDDSPYLDIMMDERIDVDRIMAELGIGNIAPALLASDLGQRFFRDIRQAMASDEVGNTTIEDLIRKSPKADQDSLKRLFEAAGILPKTRLVDLGMIFTKQYTPPIIKRKITAARHPLTKSFWVEMLKTALRYGGKNDETMEKEIKGILEIDTLATEMADSDKEYHAHGTNAMALKTILDPRFDGILFPGYDIRSRGGMVLSGETGGLTNANKQFVSTINLSYFRTEMGVRVGYLFEAMEYARLASSTEPQRLRFRIAPDCIDEAILKLKKFVRNIEKEGYSYDPYYIGFLERLGELRGIKKYFKGLSQEERDEIDKLSKIPVVIIGYDSGERKASSKIHREIEGEDTVQQLTTTIVATTNEYIDELSELLKRHGKEKDIRVISIEDAEPLQHRYLTALGMTRGDFGEPQIGQMKVIGRRDPMDEDTELDLTDRHAEFEEKAEGVLIEDVFGINAKVIQADLGKAGAYHFKSTTGEYIIVTNSNYHIDIQEEGKYHEAREIYWMSRGFSQHEAHIIASAEQIQHFHKEGELTLYHLVLIQILTPEEFEVIKQEDEKDREYHHKVLERANSVGAGIDIQKIKDYEKLLRNKAMSKKPMEIGDFRVGIRNVYEELGRIMAQGISTYEHPLDEFHKYLVKTQDVVQKLKMVFYRNSSHASLELKGMPPFLLDYNFLTRYGIDLSDESIMNALFIYAVILIKNPDFQWNEKNLVAWGEMLSYDPFYFGRLYKHYSDFYSLTIEKFKTLCNFFRKSDFEVGDVEYVLERIKTIPDDLEELTREISRVIAEKYLSDVASIFEERNEPRVVQWKIDNIRGLDIHTYLRMLADPSISSGNYAMRGTGEDIPNWKASVERKRIVPSLQLADEEGVRDPDAHRKTGMAGIATALTTAAHFCVNTEFGYDMEIGFLAAIEAITENVPFMKPIHATPGIGVSGIINDWKIAGNGTVPFELGILLIPDKYREKYEEKLKGYRVYYYKPDAETGRYFKSEGFKQMIEEFNRVHNITIQFPSGLIRPIKHSSGLAYSHMATVPSWFRKGATFKHESTMSGTDGTGLYFKVTESPIDKAVQDIVTVIGNKGIRINRERLQQILGQVSPEKTVILQDILREIDGTELSIEEIITLGDKISRLESLQDLLGKDALHKGGQLVLSILREIVITMGGRVGEEEDPVREFQRILRENLGIVDSESQGIFELIERLFHVLEYDPILGITKVDKNFYDLIDKLARIAGTSDTAILKAVGRGSLRYQLGKRFEENLVDIAMSRNITPEDEKRLRAKGVWDEFENLVRLMDSIEKRRVEAIDNLDSPFFDLIKQLEFYIALKTNALARIKAEDPQLYNDPAVQRIIKGADFPDAVIIDDNSPTAQAQRFSESNAISKRMGDFIKKDDIQRVISVPISRVFPDLDSFIRQVRDGKQKAELSYASGLAPLFRLANNVKVILRVRDIDETKRQIIEGLIRIAGLEGNVLVGEEIDNIEQLEREHSSIVESLDVKGENIVFFTDKDLTEGIKRIQDRIKNNEIKVFGIDEDSQLPAILILGYTASTVSVFSEGILSGAIRDVLKTLGMPEGEIDEMVRRGDIFIKVRLIRITQTLQEIRMRRIAIDIAA